MLGIRFVGGMNEEGKDLAMKSSEVHFGCQCQKQCLDRMQDPDAKVILPPLVRRVRLKLTRRTNPRLMRAILKYSDRIFSWLFWLAGRDKKVSAPSIAVPTTSLQAGDLVRVRPAEEIELTLNFWRQSRGCVFMQEMEPYCGTTQRVLKRVERFLDERDHQFRRVETLFS
jgi:hypothetical protein